MEVLTKMVHTLVFGRRTSAVHLYQYMSGVQNLVSKFQDMSSRYDLQLGCVKGCQSARLSIVSGYDGCLRRAYDGAKYEAPRSGMTAVANEQLLSDYKRFVARRLVIE